MNMVAFSQIQKQGCASALPITKMQQLYDAGQNLIPLGGGDDGKSPLVKFEGRSRLPFSLVIKRMEGASSTMFGIRLKGLIVIDCDTDNQATRTYVQKRFGEPPVQIKTPRGLHMVFRLGKATVPKVVREDGIAIDFKSGENSYVAGVGSIRPDGGAYTTLAGTWGRTSNLPAFVDHQPDTIEPFRVAVGGRTFHLWDRTRDFVETCSSRDELFEEMKAVREWEMASPQTFSDAELLKSVEWAWGHRLNNTLLGKGRSMVSIYTDEFQLLMSGKDGAQGLALLHVLRHNHSGKDRNGKPFRIVRLAMAEADVIPGWNQNEYRRGTNALLNAGLIRRIKEGNNLIGPSQFIFCNPIQVGGGVLRLHSGGSETPKIEGVKVFNERIVTNAMPEGNRAIHEVRVYQDGILTDGVPASENGSAVEIDVARLPGTRWVSIVAVDEDGLASLPIGRDLGSDKILPAVNVLAVGIDKYDQANNLDFAGADANTLLNGIGQADGKSIALASSKLLIDRAATPEAVLAAAEELVAKSSPGEQAVFFFAGHGAKGEDGRYYMITSSTDIDNISGTALAWDKLASVLAKSKARMTIFIDACHSGVAGTDFFSTNDEAVSGILKNIPSGLTVFSASKGRELSEEHPSIGGGYFTHAVAQVIAGDRQKYDLNKNGVIEVSELYVGVKTQVVKNTEGRQTPWLARNQMIGDFALF